MTAAEMAVGPRPRYPLVDILRGVALVVMAGYHVAWDLFYVGVLSTDITLDPGWVTLQRAILGSFVFLAGASLVLAHGERIRWRSFWRREAILVAAALAVSVGTFIAFGEYFAFFGVLHAIALFSLLALPFLRAPLWLVALVGAAVIAATFLWTDPAFINPWLAWIGFWPISPPTVDLVPVIPWFGVTLAGVLAMRLVLASPLRPMLAARGGPVGGVLAFIGRWSLILYLVHQPLLYGAISGLASLFPPPAPPMLTDAQEFALGCQPSCTIPASPLPIAPPIARAPPNRSRARTSGTPSAPRSSPKPSSNRPPRSSTSAAPWRKTRDQQSGILPRDNGGGGPREAWWRGGPHPPAQSPPSSRELAGGAHHTEHARS